MLPLPARALLASDWLSMCVAHIKRAGMRVGVYLCVTPSNRTERRVCLARLGGCACSVRLARWHDPIARARLGSAEQPIGLLGLGLIPGLITSTLSNIEVTILVVNKLFDYLLYLFYQLLNCT